MSSLSGSGYERSVGATCQARSALHFASLSRRGILAARRPTGDGLWNHFIIVISHRYLSQHYGARCRNRRLPLAFTLNHSKLLADPKMFRASSVLRGGVSETRENESC